MKEICELYNLSYEASFKNIPSDLLKAKINFMIENKISLESLNSLLFMSDKNLQISYNISNRDLLLKYQAKEVKKCF